jgi:hypothetical protein
VNEIERPGCEPGAPRIASHDLDIRQPLIGYDGSCLREVLGIEIQSGYVPRRPDPVREQLERTAWPAPEVERVPPRCDLRRFGGHGRPPSLPRDSVCPALTTGNTRSQPRRFAANQAPSTASSRRW